MVASLKPVPKNTTVDSSEKFYFQAIGIVKAQVTMSENKPVTIVIDQKEYPLFCPPKKKQLFYYLNKEIERTGSDIQRLILYPHAQHYPDKNKPYSIKFSLLGFEGKKEYKEEDLLSNHLNDKEFILKGFWQFIPVCKTPCLSIFKNYSKERKQEVSEFDSLQEKLFLKPSHLPVIWKDAPVFPFRYNPRISKDKQKPRYFVGVKTKLLSNRNCFGFKELILPPTTEAPKFLKPKKEPQKKAP